MSRQRQERGIAKHQQAPPNRSNEKRPSAATLNIEVGFSQARTATQSGYEVGSSIREPIRNPTGRVAWLAQRHARTGEFKEPVWIALPIEPGRTEQAAVQTAAAGRVQSHVRPDLVD